MYLPAFMLVRSNVGSKYAKSIQIDTRCFSVIFNYILISYKGLSKNLLDTSDNFKKNLYNFGMLK